MYSAGEGWHEESVQRQKKNYTRFYWKGPNVTKVNAVTIKEERYVEISNRFEALENMDDNVDINRT